MERPVDLDLGHQLLLRPRLRQRRLSDNLRCRDPLVFKVRELEATSETALAEEFPLQVLLDADLAIILDDFFLYDGLGAIDAFLRVSLYHYSSFSA